MSPLLPIAKALSDPNRMRALWAIKNHELCVCQIVELLELAQSTVSKHLSILRQAGLVQTEKRGRWLYCRLAPAKKDPSLKKFFEWLAQEAKVDEQLKKDETTLNQILKKDPEELCKKQRKEPL